MATSNRDYTLILDRSGSMTTEDVEGGKSRWDAVKETTMAVARAVTKLDPDGLTVYTFSGNFKRYENVTDSKVDQIFLEQEPGGSTNLAGVLKDAFDNFLARKAAGAVKDGDTILVVTDGVPDDEAAVSKLIIATSNKLDRDEELAVSILQVGQDAGAAKYLDTLDNGLNAAKFDIVDTKTFKDLNEGSMTITKVLEDAIAD